MTRDTAAWYGDDGQWLPHLEGRLRERPSGHVEPTDQDRYYDSATGVPGSLGSGLDPVPWTDESEDREAEL